jgi:uncharacterized protein
MPSELPGAKLHGATRVGMTVVRDSSPDAFLQHAGSLLYEREAEYGLALGLVEGLNSYLKPEITPLLLRVLEEGLTTAVCVQTRPDNVVISHLNNNQAAALAAYFHEHLIPLPGAIGPVPAAEALCAHYSNAPVHVRMSNRILQLTQVILPRHAPGQFRIAGSRNFDTVKRFFHDFHVECLPREIPTEAKLDSLIEDRIARQTIFLWESDGTPVSSAHSNRPTRAGISIGPVYTPPTQRGRGYASNLIAALSQHLLDQGKRFCVLFTDTHNPTSNKIYESIGYRVIGTSEFLSYT